MCKTFASYRYTSFANIHKTYFETSSDVQLCLLRFREQNSINNIPTIQRKLIGPNKTDLSPFMTLWAKAARDHPFSMSLNTDTVNVKIVQTNSDNIFLSFFFFL